jgi:pimeloyl-ACP methyl ester carboxylesterase
MNHEPFRVLADHLSRRGLAVLRVDDRGVGQSTGDFTTATSADFARDATAGFHYLQQREDIDPERIALLGHSEGGLIAPMVAAEHPEVAANVLMAGPGVDGREILILQQQLILEAQGVPAERMKELQEQQQERLEILDGDLPQDEVSARLEASLARAYESLSAAEQMAVGPREEFIASARAQMDTPWMRWFLAYDPAPTLGRVSCPVLAVNGARDLQIDPDQNLPAIAAALAAGVCEDYEIVELPELNHLFQHCETGSPAEYARIEETLAPELLDTVTLWLRDRLAVVDP